MLLFHAAVVLLLRLVNICPCYCCSLRCVYFVPVIVALRLLNLHMSLLMLFFGVDLTCAPLVVVLLLNICPCYCFSFLQCFELLLIVVHECISWKTRWRRAIKMISLYFLLEILFREEKIHKFCVYSLVIYDDVRQKFLSSIKTKTISLLDIRPWRTQKWWMSYRLILEL